MASNEDLAVEEETLRRLLKASREDAGKNVYNDAELLAAIVKEAKRDFFMGVGRVFLDEFTKWYNCTPERVIHVLKSSLLKWRYGSTNNIILINF